MYKIATGVGLMKFALLRINWCCKAKRCVKYITLLYCACSLSAKSQNLQPICMEGRSV